MINSKNYIVDIANVGLVAIAGKDYNKGEIVDTNIFIVDKKNGVLSSLFKRSDIVPYGIMNQYRGSIHHENVKIDKIDETTRYITSIATKNITQGEQLCYTALIRKNPVNNLLFENYISNSKIKSGGKGLFAGKSYKKGDIVCINPFLQCKDKTGPIKDYIFGGANKTSLNVQGDISIMNHQDKPNVNPYNFDYQNRVTIATAIRDIDKDEELFINYGSKYWSIREKNDKKNTQKNSVSETKKTSALRFLPSGIASSNLFNFPQQNYTRPPMYPIMKRQAFRNNKSGMLWKLT